jgi:3'(2'), 5'-bisphosphate nucleotidase
MSTDPTMSQLEELCQLARKAGAAILEDKARTSKVSLKEDESPLTSADLASHRTIMEGLNRIDPSIPVLSEESASIPFEQRKTWSRYFLVDPLDGTKEFIKGKKEYTVNIALIVDGVPELGVVYVPELAQTFAGARGLGSFSGKDGQALAKISVAQESGSTPRIVGSSSHASPQMAGFLETLGAHEILRFGSSLKICQIADGTAHFYPRFGPTSEWDTAAGHAVVLHAGGKVVKLDGSPLDYNQKDSVLNPSFFVIGPTDRPWLELAASVS